MHQDLSGAATRARFIRKAGAAGLFAASCLTAPALAMAAEAPTPAAAPTAAAPQGGVGEVVITARRRAENAQKVPITVIALSAKALTSANVTTANDLLRVAPGLSIMNTAASRAAVTFSIRGQGSTFGSGPGVIAYFDDVSNFGPGAAATGSAPPLFDISSVQVLKGPQGTLFGRNTTGGAVLFTPNMPSDTFNGYIDTRLGNYNRADVEFGVGGPLIGDALTFRLSGQSLNRAGYTTDITTGVKLDNENKQALRGILTFRPTSNFENTTLFQYTSENENGDGAVLTKIQPESILSGLLAPQLAEQQQLGIRKVLGSFPYQKYVADTYGVINTTNWEVNSNLSFKNIASYLETAGEKNWDLAATSIPGPTYLLGVLNPPSKNYQITEEFQVHGTLGPLNGTAGYYYEHTWFPEQIAFVEVSDVLFPALTAAFAPPFGLNGEATAESGGNVSQGPYAQVDWKVTPDLTLTGGVRYSTDTPVAGPTTTTFVNVPGVPTLSSILNSPFISNPIAQLFGAGVSPGLKHTFTALTWNFAADYTVDPSLNIYAHVSHGYKDGGFNGTAPPAFQEYQPEFVTDYELGVKGQYAFGGWQTRYDADAFYDDYTNIQRDSNISLQSGATETIIQNAAAGYIAGAELQVTVIPSPWFQVTAAYTYLDAKYTKYDPPGIGNVTGSRFPNTPTSQLTVTPVVTFPIPPEYGQLTAQANIHYQTGIATDAYNVPNGVNVPLTQATGPTCAIPVGTPPNICPGTVDLDAIGANVPGWTQVDLRVDWRHIHGTGFSAAIYGLNVLNAKYIVGTSNQLNTVVGVLPALYSAPPFYGVELRYDFGG